MLRRASMLLLSLGLAMACGGRYQSSGDDDEPGSGATGQGGSSAIAGNASRSGSSSGGKISGGTGGTISVGTGGATSVGGAPIMGGVGATGPCACDPIACAPGYVAVPDPSGCCFHCEQDVKGCDRAHAEYERMRQEMLEKYRSLGCTSDNDCTVYYEKNACDVNGCGLVVPVTGFMSLASNLENYAQMACTGCPTPPFHPCPALPPMLCRMGRCQ